MHVRSRLTSKHVLKERRGVGEPARAREACGFEHYFRFQHLVHLRKILAVGNNRASAPGARFVSIGSTVEIQCRIGCHRILSASASLTAALACKDPSTATDAMVARASSGVTSGAMLARP